MRYGILYQEFSKIWEEASIVRSPLSYHQRIVTSYSGYRKSTYRHVYFSQSIAGIHGVLHAILSSRRFDEAVGNVSGFIRGCKQNRVGHILSEQLMTATVTFTDCQTRLRMVIMIQSHLFQPSTNSLCTLLRIGRPGSLPKRLPAPGQLFLWFPEEF